MANRTRNIVLRVPVTAEERAMIERKMQQMGTGCFSVYARKMLIDGYVIRLDYSDVKAMTAELQKIGTNINQIAKRVNATGTLYAQDIEDIKGAMAEIWQLQRSILSQAAHFYDNEILGYQAQSYRGKSSKKEWWYVAASKNCPDTGRRGPSTISLKNLC